MSTEARPSAAAIADAFGLTGAVADLVPVAGAWSNRVYRLEVGGVAYAVKEVLDLWREDSWFERIDEAWRFELAAIDAGVDAPEPVPNAVTGGWRGDVAREGGPGTAVVRLHRWIDARTAPDGVADRTLAAWSGSTLARLHGLDLRTDRPELFGGWSPDNGARWPSLLEEIERADPPWAALARRADPAVTAINRYLGAGVPDRSDWPMSHRDIDQKNILLGPGGPLLCDWDVAGPVDPRAELIDVALSMARWEDPRVARVVLDAYAEAGGAVVEPTPADVMPMLFSSVDWLVINVERALGLGDVDAEEQARGNALVPGLLERLPARVAMAERIGDWLAS
jgi:hypothetical protein